MAKTTKKSKKTTAVQPADEAVQVDQVTVDTAAQTEETPQATKEADKPAREKRPEPQKLSLKEVARRRAKGFREDWWVSIQATAKVHGFQDPNTEEACVELLRRWGARIH